MGMMIPSTELLRDDWSISIRAQQEFNRARNPVGYARFQRYGVSNLAGLANVFRPGAHHPIEMFGVVSDTRFPETTLIACAGKPILEVIDHPVTRERYNAADVIERAFWDDEAKVSVFEVRRAA